MATNVRYRSGIQSLTRSFPVNTAVRAGDIVIIGALVAVAETDGDGGTASGTPTGQPDGFATCSLQATVGPTKVNIAGAGNVGDPVYAATVDGQGRVTALTLTASTNKRIGYLTQRGHVTNTPGEVLLAAEAVAD